MGMLKRGAPLALCVGALGYSSTYSVPPGHRAVVFDRLEGVKDRVVSEGIHFKLPVMQRPFLMSVRTQARAYNVTASLEDGSDVHVQVRVLFRPDEDMLVDIFKNFGLEYEKRVLPSIVSEMAKKTLSHFSEYDLQRRSEHVRIGLFDALQIRGAQFGILIEDVKLELKRDDEDRF